MKKVKLAIVTLMLGVATYGGIQTYEHLTMTDAERLMMENVEATSACEVKHRGKVVFKCTGETGTCSDSVGKTELTCSGTNAKEKESLATE